MSQIYFFGYWLRRSRKVLDLIRAERANRVGCSVEIILELETEERHPSAQIVERETDVLIKGNHD